MNQFLTFEFLKVKKSNKIMFGLFNKFTSGTPEIRQQKVTTKRNVNRTTGTRFHQRRNPVWVQYVLEEGRFRGSNTWPQAGRQRQEVTQRTGRIQYVQGPWVPYTANRSQLPFSIPQAGRSKEKAHMARKGNPIFVSLIAFVKLFFYVTPFFRLLLSYCWGGGVTGGLIFSMGSESSSSFYQWLLDSLQDREVEEVNSLLSPEVAQRLPGSNPIEIPPQDVNQDEVWREVHAMPCPIGGYVSHDFKIKDLIRKYFDGSLLNVKSKC